MVGSRPLSSRRITFWGAGQTIAGRNPRRAAGEIATCAGGDFDSSPSITSTTSGQQIGQDVGDPIHAKQVGICRTLADMTMRFSAQSVATCSTKDSVDVQLSTQKMSLHLDVTLLLEGPRNLDFAEVESCPVYYLVLFGDHPSWCKWQQ